MYFLIDLLEAFGYAELPSVLKEFVDTRGLEMVAHRLPMVYPTHYLRTVSSPYDTPTCSQNDPSWVKLDVNDDIYEVMCPCMFVPVMNLVFETTD